jgi:YihY family inner membrane protein
MKRVKRSSWYQELIVFWTKVNNDWIFNLAGLLAYNFLVALFPILIVLLGVVGLFLGNLSAPALDKLEASIVSFLPGIDIDVVKAIATNLENSASILLVIGLATSFFAGTRLFIVVENCFSIVFRLPSRNVVWQNIMAFGMMALYLVVVVTLLLLSLFPSADLGIDAAFRNSIIGSALLTIGRWAASLFVITLVLAILYAFVPPRPRPEHTFRAIWRGTLVAAFLIFLFELLFPLIRSLFLRTDNYGAIAAFFIVILFFFYYLGFIVLLGAEVNSWAAGQRATPYDLPGLLREADQVNESQSSAGS